MNLWLNINIVAKISMSYQGEYAQFLKKLNAILKKLNRRLIF